MRRLSGKTKSSNQLQQSEFTDNQFEQYTVFESQQQSVNSAHSAFIENRLEKMQPTTLSDELENVDLTTESLPAVDTPDACDKAALR